MIPKIIHYCWFGRGEMPKIMKKCLRSWKKYCPDWQIVRWDEDSFDVDSSLWTRQAYDAKKYAFVADYVRLQALYEMGGVYLDTDQELVKTLEPFRKHPAFLGFTDGCMVSAGIIGAYKEHPLIGDMLEYYNGRAFQCSGEQDMTPNTDWMTQMLVDRGLVKQDQYQELAQVAVYPQTYFCPTTCLSVENCITKDTVSLHHWAMSWRSKESKRAMDRLKFRTTRFYRSLEWLRYLPNRMARRLLGENAIEKLKNKIKK